jgi:selenocysteine lyase/cysteine desulfurase
VAEPSGAPDHPDDAPADLRSDEYSYLDRDGHVYLDYTGSGLASQSQLRAHHDRLSTGLFGNPHSENPTSRASTERVESARRAVLRHLKASAEDYAVVFTANATGACRLVGEAYPFDRTNRLVLTTDNHNSVNGLREFARARGARTVHVPVSMPQLRVDREVLTEALATRSPRVPRLPSFRRAARRPGPRTDRPDRRRGLLAYPAQSNFSGVQHSLDWIELAHQQGYDVLLDAAAYLPTNLLDLSRFSPDFVAISWYKVFGYPTGVGCLVARKEALTRLRRPWFSGGTIVAVSVNADWHWPTDDESAFEDGTLNFLSIPDVEVGLSWVESVGVPRTHRRVIELTGLLLAELASLRHRNGAPLVQVYGPLDTRDRGGTIALNLLDPDGTPVDERRVAIDSAAEGISLRTGCFCNPGAGESAFDLAGAPLRGSARWGVRTIDEYLTMIGLLTAGAVRVSLGIASNQADVERFVEFLRVSYLDRPASSEGLAPRLRC